MRGHLPLILLALMFGGCPHSKPQTTPKPEPPGPNEAVILSSQPKEHAVIGRGQTVDLSVDVGYNVATADEGVLGVSVRDHLKNKMVASGNLLAVVGRGQGHRVFNVRVDVPSTAQNYLYVQVILDVVDASERHLDVKSASYRVTP